MSPHAPTLCIYHSPCADGFSAAWAVWRKYGDSIKYLPGIHGVVPPTVADEHVWFVDFSYKNEVMRSVIEAAASVTVLDHHKSAEADLAPLLADGSIGGLFDMNRSGAVIAWQYCHPDAPVPDLLLHVQDYDLWQFTRPDTRAIVAVMCSYEYDFETWDRLARQCARPHVKTKMIAEGVAIERKLQKDVKEMLTLTTRSMVIGGMHVPVANLPVTMASEGANQLAQNAPFAAAYYDRADGRVFSLRSVGIDVSEIAARYGGGGHHHAAGFQAEHGWEGDRPEDKV